MISLRQVPYTPSEGHPLNELRENEDVMEIRDTYKADLVQLVGDLDGVCGEA